MKKNTYTRGQLTRFPGLVELVESTPADTRVDAMTNLHLDMVTGGVLRLRLDGPMTYSCDATGGATGDYPGRMIDEKGIALRIEDIETITEVIRCFREEATVSVTVDREGRSSIETEMVVRQGRITLLDKHHTGAWLDVVLSSETIEAMSQMLADHSEMIGALEDSLGDAAAMALMNTAYSVRGNDPGAVLELITGRILVIRQLISVCPQRTVAGATWISVLSGNSETVHIDTTKIVSITMI